MTLLLNRIARLDEYSSVVSALISTALIQSADVCVVSVNFDRSATERIMCSERVYVVSVTAVLLPYK